MTPEQCLKEMEVGALYNKVLLLPNRYRYLPEVDSLESDFLNTGKDYQELTSEKVQMDMLLLMEQQLLFILTLVKRYQEIDK